MRFGAKIQGIDINCDATRPYSVYIGDGKTPDRWNNMRLYLLMACSKYERTDESAQQWTKFSLPETDCRIVLRV